MAGRHCRHKDADRMPWLGSRWKLSPPAEAHAQRRPGKQQSPIITNNWSLALSFSNSPSTLTAAGNRLECNG